VGRAWRYKVSENTGLATAKLNLCFRKANKEKGNKR
jgi:hypothetical protein